jgi:hypothetical protein
VPFGNDVVVMLKGGAPAPPVIVTLNEALLDTSALLVAVILNVAGLGNVAGAVYVNDGYVPVMVP